MRRSFLCTIVFAAACLLLCAHETRAQYAYGASGIGYDPNTKIVYGYSRTSLDYWAGTYYDPYVEGYLLDPYSVLDWGYSTGYESYVPAVVETAAYTAPSTRYDVLSDHYVIAWYYTSVTVCEYYGFYGGCGYDPYGFGSYFGGGYGGFNYFYGGYGGYQQQRVFYLGRTGIAGITPPPDECEGESSTSAAMSDDGGGTAQPQAAAGGTSEYEPSSSTYRDTVALSSGSSCALLPKVAVQSVGFKGDWDVKQYVNGDTNDPVIAPGNAPTWVKGRSGDDKFVVAYTMGQAPTIFATLAVSGADPNASASLRVKRGDTVLATMPIDVSSNGNVFIDDIGLPAQLGEAVTSREKNYNFKWEVSFDGRTWKSAGESGDHKIYWTFGDPYGAPNLFRNSQGQEYAGLYDLALEKSIGKLGDGTTDVLLAIKKITEAVASELEYNPKRIPTGGHPLSVYKRTRKDYQCDDNAFLLRGLLRSAGTDGDVKYYYGGNPTTKAGHWYIAPGSSPDPTLGMPNGENTTARFPRNELVTLTENIGRNPYFTFHSTVTAGTGSSYDPSYGLVEPEVKLLQAVNSAGTCLNGEAANGARVISTGYMTGGRLPFNRACGNTASTGGTGIPRGASVVSQSVPAFMEAGAAYLVSVTLHNDGDNTWTDADLYRLGSQNPQDNLTWGIGRVHVPRSVAPGEEVTFDFYVTAPSYAGYYNFQWRMVQDGVEWFGAHTPNVQVEVYSLYTCDMWQEQDCWNRGGSWDSTSCYCHGGYYYY